ncbi:MAG TPA: UbiA family prenyltransferase [Vicinamibacterales bacterium]|nr:UbiA family prenyltransferase [Vicinamibacterales bacterium]
MTSVETRESIRQRSYAVVLISLLRPHHWLKNLLIVVPAIAAHRIDWATAGTLALAFSSFSLCASGGYVFNDVLDSEADRQHPRKRTRALASRRVSTGSAVSLIVLTWAAGLGIAVAALPREFGWLMAAYVAATIGYSIRLKREPALDVVVLAVLNVWRIIAGGAATSIPVSTWLLAFTLFVCLSLALLKRFIEVLGQPAAAGSLPGRGYQADDAQWLHSAGLAAAYLSVVVLALYVNSPAVSLLYDHPDRLLLMCPVLLYWSTRAWLRAHRRQSHDDPVLLVALDPVTYVLLVVCAIIVMAAM